MSRITEKIVALLLALFLLAYVGYQAWRYYFEPLQVETVFEYSVSHTVNTTGLVVRDEQTITHSSPGIESYVWEDGTRVSVDQVVVEFFESDVSDRNVRRMRELELEMEMLADAQNPTVSNYSNVESFNRDIKEQLSGLTTMMSLGRFDDAQAVKAGVTGLLNKRQVAIGKEDSYQRRIDALQAEYDHLVSVSAISSMEVAKAPVSGYFAREVDGLESRLTTGLLDNLADADSFRELMEWVELETAAVPRDTVGKIVTDQNWYYVALVPQDDVQWIKPGRSVTVDFDAAGQTVPGTVHNILTQNHQEEALLILHCNYISGDLLAMRTSDAVVHFQQYSGLRINTADLRFVDDERGVYVLSRNTVYFKKVDPVYEDAAFILSRINTDPRDTDTVKQFDQVIIRGGKDLYHGKVID